LQPLLHYFNRESRKIHGLIKSFSIKASLVRVQSHAGQLVAWSGAMNYDWVNMFDQLQAILPVKIAAKIPFPP